MEEYPKVYLYRRIVQAKKFIDENFASTIDLNLISEYAFFSKFHFVRLFKNAYGITPHQYLTRVRINHAKLLLEENHKISDVCFDVGFSSVSSFTGLFKSLTGETPSQFQSTILERKNMIFKSPLKYIPNCFSEKNGWVPQNSNIREVSPV